MASLVAANRVCGIRAMLSAALSEMRQDRHFAWKDRKGTILSDELKELLMTLTVDIAAAHVSNNAVAIGDMATMIRAIHQSLAGLGATAQLPDATQLPAVSIRASVKPDYIVCLEDGKKFKMLKRHLMTHYQMTPEQYRAKWSLPADYPMVAPNYAEQRRSLAKKIGLGTKRRSR